MTDQLFGDVRHMLAIPHKGPTWVEAFHAILTHLQEAHPQRYKEEVIPYIQGHLEQGVYTCEVSTTEEISALYEQAPWTNIRLVIRSTKKLIAWSKQENPAGIDRVTEVAFKNSTGMKTAKKINFSAFSSLRSISFHSAKLNADTFDDFWRSSSGLKDMTSVTIDSCDLSSEVYNYHHCLNFDFVRKLKELKHLCIESEYINHEGVEWLMQNEHHVFKHLDHLEIHDVEGFSSLDHFANSTFSSCFKKLKALTIQWGYFNDSDVLALAKTTNLPSLHSLMLSSTNSNNVISEEAAQALSESTLWKELTHVGLHDFCTNGSSMLRKLFAQPQGKKILSLTLIGLELSPNDVSFLKSCPRLQKLQSLNLSNNDLSDESLCALLDGTFEDLHTLCINGVSVEEMSLARTEGIRSLNVLELRDNALSPEVLAEIRAAMPDHADLYFVDEY